MTTERSNQGSNVPYSGNEYSTDLLVLEGPCKSVHYRMTVWMAVLVALSPVMASRENHPHVVTRTGLSERLYSMRGGGSSPTNPASPFRSWTFDAPCDTMAWTPLPKLSMKVTTEDVFEEDGSDMIVIGVHEPEDDESAKDKKDYDEEGTDSSELALRGVSSYLDQRHHGLLRKVLGSSSGTVRTTSTTNDGTIKTKRYVIMSLGKLSDSQKSDDGNEEGARGRKIGASIASKLKDEKEITSCAVILPCITASNTTLFTELTSSLLEHLYADNRYRTEKNIKIPAPNLQHVSLVVEKTTNEDKVLSPEMKKKMDKAVKVALEDGMGLAAGIYLAKDIVNAPHNVLNSLSLAETAKRLVTENTRGTLKVEILEKRDCEKRGMGCYLGVARGSETEPKFIHITYRSPTFFGRRSKKNIQKLGIVGKGLLFDTGGYNIKTGSMELMKFDCGGAAAVLGAARALGKIAPEGVEAHFIVAACENMINERSILPSDILVASNGKTVEIGNTDAEGRLTMADALVFADQELKCDTIIELSTLTGACMISLGTKIAGLWTSNDALASRLKDASNLAGERIWRMPLEDAYKDQLKSKIADLKNIGSTRYGGAITAALFLQEFIQDTKATPFAHIDMAGPVWDFTNGGASGYGVRLVTEWICRSKKDPN